MKTISALIGLGLLAGCTTVATDVYYGPLGADAGVYAGYSELMRSSDSWAVRYTGDPKMTGTMVRDLTLLRAADITRDAGFQWFMIVDKVNESGHVLEGTSFSGVATAQVSSGWSGGVDKLTGSQSVNTTFISQYRYEIRCFREDPGNPEALDATVVETEVRAKYGLPEAADPPQIGTGSS